MDRFVALGMKNGSVETRFIASRLFFLEFVLAAY